MCATWCVQKRLTSYLLLSLYLHHTVGMYALDVKVIDEEQPVFLTCHCVTLTLSCLCAIQWSAEVTGLLLGSFIR